MKKVSKLIGIISFIGVLLAIFLNIVDITNIFKDGTDLSGEWVLKFKIKESSYTPYVNKVAEYKIHIIQVDNTITGQGEKWKFDSKVIPFNERSPLLIEGIFRKDTLFCTYVLKGSARETSGSFNASFNDNKLIGSFSGTGANAKGLFSGEKISNTENDF